MQSQLEREQEAKNQWLPVHYNSKDGRHSFGAYACEWAESSDYGTKTLYYMKIMGSHSAVRGLMAACQMGHTLQRALGGSRMREARPASEKGARGRVFTERLPSGSFMGIWVTEEERFIMGRSNQQIFQMIRERFTLPALPQWSEVIMEALSNRGYLDSLNTHRCSASFINCDEASIDGVVSDLVRSKAIAF